MIERAVTRRDAAVNALTEYGSAVVDAIAAVVESDLGAHIDGRDLGTAADIADHLERSRPQFAGLTVPADLVGVLRGVIDGLAAVVPVYTAKKGDTDG